MPLLLDCTQRVQVAMPFHTITSAGLPAYQPLYVADRQDK